MPNISRRRFIRDASIGVAAAGAAATVAPALVGTGSLAGAAPAATPSGEPSTEGPIVAHVVNARTGEIAIYVGTREVRYKNATVARQLTAAAAQ
jgi:hypothetical protein